MELFQLN